jgi:hypothetical protein
MPIEFNGKIAVRASELIPNWYSSVVVLSKQLNRDEKKDNYGMKKIQSGGNGRELLIDFDSLDIEIRRALGDPRTVRNWMEKFFVMDEAARIFYMSYRFEGGAGLGDEHIKEYTMNASTARACLVLREARERERLSKGGSLRGVPTTIWNDAILFRKIQKMKYGFEHTLPNNERRFLEAVSKYEKMGNVAFISRKHQNKNAVKVTADVMELLNNLFAGVSLKPSMTDVFRQYMRFLIKDLEVIDNETGEVINPEGYPDLSDTTILGYLSKWEQKIGTWSKRSGNRQIYMNQFKTPHKMKKPEFASSLISVDDRQPPFKMANGKRIWFYNAIDLSSEVWTAWVHGETKEGIIKEFYREILRNYASWGIGLPLELECESSLNTHLRDTILADGAMFQRIRIEANNAVGKKIERFYRTIRYGAEKDLEGWIARPFAKLEANQAKSDKEKTLSYGTIAKQSMKVMEEWNNQPHSTIEGKTRWEVFLENQNPASVKPINWDVLLPYLGKETKTSCKVGLVNLNNGTYCIGRDGKLATGDDLLASMKLIEGKQILVRWLDDNDGKMLKAHAYKDGRFMCELVPQPIYNRSYYERIDEGGEVEYEAMSKYSNTITAFGTRQRKAISSITILKRTEQADEEIKIAEVLEDIEVEDFVYNTPKKEDSLWDRW